MTVDVQLSLFSSPEGTGYPPTASYSPDYLRCPGCGERPARWNMFEAGLWQKMLCNVCRGLNRKPRGEQ